jgi:hypothetical protein
LKTVFEWWLAILGSLGGAFLAFWGIRTIYFTWIKEHSVGRKAIEERKAKEEELEDKAKVIDLEIRRLELQVQSNTKRLDRLEKFVEDNYDDMRDLDEKVERLRQVQDSKIL